MRKRARTVLCGGRSATIVPTASLNHGIQDARAMPCGKIQSKVQWAGLPASRKNWIRHAAMPVCLFDAIPAEALFLVFGVDGPRREVTAARLQFQALLIHFDFQLVIGTVLFHILE